MMRTALLLVLLSGCLKSREGQDPAQCNDYLDNDDNGVTDCDELLCANTSHCQNNEADADADGDADADADSDVDDTGEWNPDTDGYDTGEPGTRTYQGDFNFLIQFQNELEGLDDTCDAAVSFDLNSQSQPNFSTTFVCAWNGSMESALGSDLTIELTGNLGTSGSLAAYPIDLSTTWAGSTNSSRILGSTNGEGLVSGYAYAYEVEFAFYRQ